MNLVNNRYETGGVDLLNIAEEFGTPVYVYDAQKIRDQYKLLTSAFSDVNVKIRYACKALTNQNILRLLKGLGSGLDTVSIEEVELGIKAGYQPEEIICNLPKVLFTILGLRLAKIVIINPVSKKPKIIPPIGAITIPAKILVKPPKTNFSKPNPIIPAPIIPPTNE